MPNELIARACTGTANGLLDAAAEAVVAQAEDLSSISVVLVQVTDAGTATLVVEKTLNGTDWIQVASKADSDFAAGAGATIEIPLSDSNGMPVVAKQLRVRASALAGGGVYSAHIAGRQVGGFR